MESKKTFLLAPGLKSVGATTPSGGGLSISAPERVEDRREGGTCQYSFLHFVDFPSVPADMRTCSIKKICSIGMGVSRIGIAWIVYDRESS